MDDAELVRQLESCSLPFEQWTHRAHVRVAYTLLQAQAFPVALARFRGAVKAYNAKNNVPESPTSGYNETTTHALLHLILATMRAYPGEYPSADAFCDTHPQLMTRHCLRLFYSPGQRIHPLAKTQFVEPDLAPLPRIM